MKGLLKVTSSVLAVMMAASSLAVTSASAASVSKTKLSVSNTSAGVKITWKKAKGAKKYVVMRKLSNAKKYTALKTVKGSKTLSYTDKKAKAGKTYSYTVRTVNGNVFVDSAAKKIVRLKTPTSVKAKLTSYETVDVSWKKVKGAKKYEVYRAAVSGSKTGKYKKLNTTKSKIYEDWSVSSGKYYKYKVRAVKNSSKSAYSKTSQNIMYLSAPYSEVSMNSDYTGVNVMWEKASGAKGYRVYRSTSEKSGYKMIADIKSSAVKTMEDPYGFGETVCYYEDKNVVENTKYFYYVTAYSGSVTSSKDEDSISEITYQAYDVALKVGERNTEFLAMFNSLALLGAKITVTSEDESIVKANSTTLIGVAPGDAFVNVSVTMSGQTTSGKIKVRVIGTPTDEEKVDLALKVGEVNTQYSEMYNRYSKMGTEFEITSENESIVTVEIKPAQTEGGDATVEVKGIAPGETYVNIKAKFAGIQVYDSKFKVSVTENSAEAK